MTGNGFMKPWFGQGQCGRFVSKGPWELGGPGPAFNAEFLGRQAPNASYPFIGKKSDGRLGDMPLHVSIFCYLFAPSSN